MDNTPMTDERKASFATDTIRQLESELAAAREEITLLKTNLKIQTNHTENAVQDRADEHIELHNQIHELREQRDRLAEALQKNLLTTWIDEIEFEVFREAISALKGETDDR